MEDTSLTGVYGKKEIQSTSKKYVIGSINIHKDNEAFTNVAEFPLIMHSLCQDVQKQMANLGTKNPKQQEKYRRDAENCCRLIQNFIAAILYGGLNNFPDTKFMVYMMTDQFVDPDGSNDTIDIDSFKTKYMGDTTCSSASPLYDFKLPNNYQATQLRYIREEDVMTSTMQEIDSTPINETYSEEEKMADLDLHLTRHFNDFAKANAQLHLSISNMNTQKIIGTTPNQDGILHLRKLLIKLCSQNAAGNIGGPLTLKLKVDNVLNNLLQFDMKARLHMLRHLFVYSNHNTQYMLLTVNILQLINKAFINLTEDNMLKSAHKLAELNNNMERMSLSELDSLFAIIEADINLFLTTKNMKTFQISKTDGTNTQHTKNYEKKKTLLDKPCQACTYLEVVTGQTLHDEPHHAKDCKNFSSKMVDKIWTYKIENNELKTAYPEMPEKFNLKEISSNADYKTRFASKPRLTPAQQPKPKQKQQK
jgi:hypothetical protein